MSRWSRGLKTPQTINLLLLVIIIILLIDVAEHTMSCNKYSIGLLSRQNTVHIRSKVLRRAIFAAQAFYEKRQAGFTDHIPSIIHQIWYDWDKAMPPQVSRSVESFQQWNPHATRLLWRRKDLDELVEHFYPWLNNLFSRLPSAILKADFLRFLLLQQFGGVYSDIDTLCLKPAYEWSNGRSNVSLITGYEASLRDDMMWQTHPNMAKPLARDVQLASWTVAAAPLHPLVVRLVHGCVSKLGNMTSDEWVEYDVLEFAGPGAWTDVILDYIRSFGYTEDDIYRAQRPIQVSDVYILPAAGFRWESNGDEKWACIRHTFLGSWKSPSREKSNRIQSA
ncbi:hypothetical protein GpartN1_g5172.t1 [Galdieria partita]|uniref:Initiation-specific alpha-1,6-mannosyltransferase n=1 Tax=Galdieria partita TaxID=83374 RepID=A0A9C7Q0N8_9RHOD|nr:hypothetical protein GpartN1_g5172.t1 [Galdieria partita]